MADISKIILPSGSEYDIKDATARSSLSSYVTIAQGSANNGKILYVNSSGNVDLKNEKADPTSITNAQIDALFGIEE